MRGRGGGGIEREQGWGEKRESKTLMMGRELGTEWEKRKKSERHDSGEDGGDERRGARWSDDAI